jgi:glycerophosphoryl diester phosphodiesterase
MENIIIVAHRGFSGVYPENTLLAFQKAVELGVDFVELDVHQTVDKEIVVCHDYTIDRTTDGNGYIKEMTYEEIKKYDAGKWKGYPGEKIPLLKEVFEKFGEKIKILIEIKECDVSTLIKLIKEYRMEKRVIVGSFNLEYIKEVRNLLPLISTALISYEVPENIDQLIKYGIRKLDIEFHNLNKEIVKELVSYGFVVNTWTPDTEEELKKVIDYGVQFITTDRPDILKEIIKNGKGF